MHRVEVFFALDIVNDKFYHIDLTLNKNLLPKSFGITTYTKYGHRLVQHQSQQVCSHNKFDFYGKSIGGVVVTTRFFPVDESMVQQKCYNAELWLDWVTWERKMAISTPLK